MARDPYEVLGVAPESPKEEISAAYKRMALRLHPDRNPGDPDANQKFVELNQAYSVLSDDAKKREYDRQKARMNGFHDIPPGVNVHFGFGFRGFGVDQWGHPSHRDPVPGADVEVELHLTLKEAVLGTTRSIRARTGYEVACPACGGSRATPGTGRAPCTSCAGTGKNLYPGQGDRMTECRKCAGHGDIPFRPCRECSGKGKARAEREVALRVPSGSSENHRLRLAGQGEIGAGGPPGDMFVTLKIAEDSRFTRKGVDLHTTVRVPFHIAAGKKPIQVTGIDGKEHTVELTSMMRPGETTMAIPNAGVPSLAGSRGRLLVTLQADLPAPKTARGELLLKELLEELSGRSPSVPSPDD